MAAGYTDEEMICFIERFIAAYDGTCIGSAVKCMYENAGGREAESDALEEILDHCDAGQK